MNYNLGEGSWERLPMAVTYDYNDLSGGYFSGFSQSFDVSPDNTTLYQATNVENFNNSKTINGVSYNLNDVRAGALPLDGTIYEAEKAVITDARSEDAVDASNGKEVRYINESDSSVDFQNIKVEKSANYRILIRYSKGETSEASHMVTVNGKQIGNKNGGKYLEVSANSSEDGAGVGQWGPTGYGCQEWTLIKEGVN